MKLRTTPLFIIATFLVFVGASCNSGADGGVFLSTDEGETWVQKVFVNQEGRKVNTIAGLDVELLRMDPVDSSVMYIASQSSGALKTTTSGEQWIPLPLPKERVRDIAVNPVVNTDVYAAIGNNVYKSADGGASWEIVFTDTQGGNVKRIAIDWYNTQRIFVGTTIGSILLSEDGGVNWKVVFQVNEPFTELLIDRSDSRIVYALELDHALHKSVDGGFTWVNLLDEDYTEQSGKNSTRVKQLSLDPNNTSTLYLSSSQGISRSTDRGETWVPLSTLIERGAEENSSILNMTVTPGDSSTLYFTVGRLIHKSMDTGNTWKTIETFPSQRKITSLIIHPEQSSTLYASVQKQEKERRGPVPSPSSR